MRAFVPGLTVQPLLENAIYHGIEPLERGGTVTVSGSVVDGVVEIVVTNPVAPSTAAGRAAAGQPARARQHPATARSRVRRPRLADGGAAAGSLSRHRALPIHRMSAVPLSVLIVDDELPARERLQRLVAELPGCAVAGVCSNGADALSLVGKLKPAVVLLDIRMPGMTGIEVARHLGALEQPPAIVFTTAYDEYALEAFESQAVGYLLKPVRSERLAQALKHASRLRAPQLLGLGLPGAPLAARQHVAVRLRDELKLIPVKDIRYFRAEQKYVTVRHTRGEDLIDESLKQLEEEFARDFVRAHRSILVAIAHVEALERCTGDDGYALRLRGEAEPLAVSRRQLAELRKRLASH